MLTRIYCSKHQTSQYVDLAEIDSIEVSDSDYGRGGYTYGKSEYSSVMIGLKSGHSLNMTIKTADIEKLLVLEHNKI
ncbi:hypothetical protein [Acinetobacter modestus]|uniref:Uncharacterized protein n=1 Tax=Acinetobacter modestus TaxID=1776740 RepID=A0ABN0JP91_9GAMM|nr:hypothetical protein [Acinetobacter modestus]ENU27071.1 hypothetical protein F992_01676 [Acinetobacter modestus]GGA18116.1 hypothetical protein GCM10017554_13670 [Acinetobacter modestus]